MNRIRLAAALAFGLALVATRAQAQITSALRLFGMHGNPDHSAASGWQPAVIQMSALHGQGVDEFWRQVSSFQKLQNSNGQWAARRQQQAQAWMWERIESGLRQQFRNIPQVRQALPELTQQVAQGLLPASTAARTAHLISERSAGRTKVVPGIVLMSAISSKH